MRIVNKLARKTIILAILVSCFLIHRIHKRRVLQLNQANLSGYESEELLEELFNGDPFKIREICPTWNKPVHYSSSPIINLNPERFVFPSIDNGPSIQLIALQEAILFGIKTNRTPVVPNFLPHFTDKASASGKIVHAKLRIDLENLSRLVSLTATTDMEQKCKYHFDTGYQDKPSDCWFRHFIRTTTNMTFSEEIPSDEDSRITFGKRRKCEPVGLTVSRVNRTEWGKGNFTRFRNDLRCIILINVYRSFHRNASLVDEDLLSKAVYDPKALRPYELQQASPDTLIRVIEEFTLRPQYLQEIASRFLQDVMRVKAFVSLHWRYNKEWGKTYCRPEKPFVDFCDKIHAVEPYHIAGAFAILSRYYRNGTKTIQTACSSPHVINGYLATTKKFEAVQQIIDDDSFRRKYFLEDYRCWKLRIFDIHDLVRFIATEYPKSTCPELWTDLHELVALLENELCRLSTVFSYSVKSAWSDVARQRRSHKINLAIWDILEEVNRTEHSA